jgi:hypothetical protein
MAGAPSLSQRVPWATIAALLIAALSVLATLRAIDFPLGTIGDEFSKVSAMQGAGNFLHPLLMVHLARAAGALSSAVEPQALAEVGRVCAAIFGGVFIFATFMQARLVLPAWLAVVSAAVTAATPLVTVHARIFKEDIFVASFVVLGLLALIRLLKTPTPVRAALLGVLIGLAAGSKYIGAVLLPFALLAIGLLPSRDGSDWRQQALIVAGAAGLVFLLIESPAFFAIVQLKDNVGYELRHIVVGHDVPLPVTLTYGVFHLSQGLWSELGAPLLVFGLLGLAAPFFASPERVMPLAVIASFSVVWYVLHELSPLKPYPDFARYMLPLASLLPMLGISFFYEPLARRDQRGVVAAAVALLAALPGLTTSLRVNGAAADPRAVVAPIISADHVRAALDRYASYDTTGRIFGRMGNPPDYPATDLVVTANFAYDRYDSYPVRSLGPRGARYYEKLAKLPHLDVTNGQPALGYFNPTLRVVAVDGKVDTLRTLAEQISAAAPSLSVRLVQSEPSK